MTAQPHDRGQEQVPRQVKWASILLAVFGGLGLMLAMLLLSAVNTEPDAPTWVYGLVGVQFLLSGLQVLSGIFLWFGRAWARTTATVVCSINLVGAVFSLLTGNVLQAITAAAVNIALLRMLRGHEVKEWFE